MECGNCILCCKLLEIQEVESKFNEWCKYCDQTKGCMIYDERPESCRIFNCTWVQMKKVGIEMRPDKCGVVFEKFSDYVILGIMNGWMSERVWGQINYFNREGISVVLFNHGNKSKAAYLAEGHTKQFVEKEIDDSTKLYRRFN